MASNIISLEKKDLPKGCKIEKFSEDLVIYELLSPSDHPLKLQIFDARDVIPFHYHQIQTQLIFILEGSILVSTPKVVKTIREGQLVVIPSGVSHQIEPMEKVRFIAIDLPGFVFPEDIYEGKVGTKDLDKSLFITEILSRKPIINKEVCLNPSLLDKLTHFSKLTEEYYLEKVENRGYDAYLFGVDSKENKWSVAILDLIEVPAHFHKIGAEHFMVLGGELSIDLDGSSCILRAGQGRAGQSVHIPPNVKHHLKTALTTPVRLLCINLPAFDIQDFYQ